MNLCLRLLALIAFSVILLSNHSSLAAESCEGLFASDMKVKILASSGPYYLLNQYYRDPSPAGKIEVEASLQKFEASIHEALNERNIQFETVTFENPDLGINWTEFVISPNGTHPLNKFAASMKKLEAEVAFNPLVNTSYNFTASFLWMQNKLLISREAVLNGLTHIDAHEGIHALFLAQRLGKAQFLPKAPVGIHMESVSGINPKSGNYNRFMSFEELVTYAFNLKYTAKQAVKFIKNKASSQYIKSFDDAWKMLATVVELSNNATLASEKAQILLQQKKYSLSQENGEKVLVLKTDDDDFKLTIFLPKNITQPPEVYAAKQLHDAIALAQFTRTYFETLRGLDDDVILNKAVGFSAAQRHFINSL